MDCYAPKGAGLLPLDDALARIVSGFGPAVDTETVPLASARGRVLAEPVTAPIDVPPAAVSAMDGYGYAAASGAAASGGAGPFTLPVVGRVPAGSVFSGTVGAGQAVRIFTGAPVPAGVDTVAMQEDCTAHEDGSVTVNRPPKPGANIRPAGEDMRAGAVVLHPGARLRAQDVGLAAAVGRAGLRVRQRVTVVLFSTGDELREPGTPKPEGAIYDANRYTIAAQLQALGVEVEDLGILPDRAEVVRDALAGAAARGHLIVTSGGVSVGEEDHVKAAVNALGGIDLWRLAIKPGKPVALGKIRGGRVGGTPFLGLPGNPVSAMVTFMLIGRPLVMRLMGVEKTAAPRCLAVAGFSFRKKAGRREFLRATLGTGPDGLPVAHKFPNDSSGVLTSMVEADGLVDIPADTQEVREGDMVAFLPFTGLFV